MSKIKTSFTLLSVTVFGMAAVAGAFWYVSAKNDESLAIMRLRIAMEKRSDSAINEVVTLPLGRQTNTSNAPNSLQVAGASSSAAQAAEPLNFSDYNKYETAESALFADIVVGNGAEVTTQSKVAALYQGWLTDGTLFDQTKADASGKLLAFVFQMGAKQVIPGWEQGIVGMKVGGKRRIVVPPAVGYGAEGQGPIPANAVLVFDVEVVTAL